MQRFGQLSRVAECAATTTGHYANGFNQNNDMEDLQKFGMDLTVDDTFKSVVHAVAMNENRYQFSRRSIYNDHVDATLNNNVTNTDGNFRLEKGFLGAHSDISGYDRASVFNTQNHLELSWEGTKAFENPDYKRFDIIKKQTEDFLATGEAFREGDLAGMVLSHPWQFRSKMKKYKELKQEGKSEGRDILFNSKEKGKIIRITDYLNWVNCHYGLNLSTSVIIDLRLPAEQSICKNT